MPRNTYTLSTLGSSVSVLPSGSVLYSHNGDSHRDNGPSEVSEAGYIFYERESRIHREDGPASYAPIGAVFYYLEHRRLSEEDFLGRTLGKK